MGKFDIEAVARRNTLANLHHWRVMLYRAGNREWMLWDAAYHARVALLGSGKVEARRWE